ncbi:hypothetical protein JAAARDRAFT_140013 [Jaapia argillacea MUCL 33604]|uniref:Protein kinase domain-containing protein n=1 Tax=Jaapia argillacea MUCL 33604 TaxID=933084 RepID=A0A067PKP1_9AGAM|nr:hypothetical protein JAAARDRAFT_140013 [Jaapia argillacea MUCL 33604]
MLLQEVLVWRQIDHPSILPFDGVWRESDDSIPYLLTPWMAHGNAHSFAQAEHPGQVIDRLLIEVVEGLAYLHREEISHGDLTGVSIKISDGEYHARLCDFGLAILFKLPSSLLYCPSSSGGDQFGNIRWMAPETHYPQLAKPSFETDIYQFACVALELYTGQVPFPELRDIQVPSVVVSGARPRYPGAGQYGRTLPQTLWGVMEQCWEQTPSDRPTALDVLKMLQI